MGRLVLEEALNVERGHTATTGGGYCLTVDVIRAIACGKYTFDAGGGGIAGGASADLDVAILHVELTIEDAGVRLVADGDEHTAQADVFGAAIFGVLDAQASDASVVAQHFIHRAVPFDGDVASLGQANQFVGEDLLGAELVAAVHHGDVFRDVGQIQGLFHSGVAAANDCNLLATVEETVAGGAARNAAALELLFGVEAEVFGRRAGGDDQGITGVAAHVAVEAERALAQVYFFDLIKDHFGAEALGLLAHFFDQTGTVDAVLFARPVIDLGGGGELAALLQAGNEHRLNVGAGRVDGGGVAGWAGTEDQQTAVLALAHDRLQKV